MEVATSSAPSCSSFLKSEPHFIYDAFINFGGEDIGKRFVSHLHYVLLQGQVKTLIKEENLLEGMKLEEHMRAIGRTKITIIVFSKSYAESTCCLLELEKIIECYETFGQIVLTVFYEIDKFDLRYHQNDDYEKALSMWSRALTSNVWNVGDFRHDAALVEVIVSRVQTLLDYKDLFVTQFPVGLDSHVEKVIECIQNHDTKVCMIGIWGMGGSGKTTLAKSIYNRIYRLFIGKSFVENIRDLRDRLYRTYRYLQENLLDDVLKYKFELESDQMGRTMFQTELSRKKLLIVLDDVNEFGQLENLCGNREWFGQGTVIIITTRDVNLLKQLKVNYVYEMHLLNGNDSLELFSWHAFREPKPRKELNDLARNIAAYCGGLPLALEFLGSYLCDSTMEEWWKRVFSKLKLIPIEVQYKLTIGFDGLDQMKKDIFLDVCCFFIGKDRNYVIEILNGCGLHADVGITVLIERALIKVERNNKLQMHPLLREMGREISRQLCPKEPGKRSRLWFKDEVKDVLKENTGTETIEGLSLKLQSSNTHCFEARAFEEMKRLRLLQLHHVQLDGDFDYLSKQLRWICWKGFPYKYIPNNFHLENVIAIDFKHSHLQLLWEQPLVLQRLKFLNLSHSKYLRETPDFSGLPSLEQLILKDCPSLCKVHPSIGDLSNIVVINLKDCLSLSNLPIEIYKLKSLRNFIVSGCSMLGPLEKFK